MARYAEGRYNTSLDMTGHNMAHAEQRKGTRASINEGVTLWPRVYKKSTGTRAATDENTVVGQDQAAARAVPSMSCFCSRTPYEHRLFSMSCEAAMASEHYVDITTGGPRPRRPPMAGTCTHSAKGFHGWRRVKMNSRRCVGAIGRTRQGDADDARGRAGARRPDRAPGLAQDPPVRAGRGERPAGVGRPGGGSLPCGARLGTPPRPP